MTANPERGEATISLEGVEYGMRPSFAAIQAIEEKTASALFPLAIRAAALELSVADLGKIAGETMRAWGKANPDNPNGRVAVAVKDERVAELIYEEGANEVSRTLGWLLRAALTGGVTASGELKADWLKNNPRPKSAEE